MLWDDFKKKYNNYKEQPIENLSIDVLKNMYKDLVYIATETAFDEVNRDTEFLLRILLLQHRINFNEESKQYENPNWDKSCEINGIKFEREKTYLINEDRVDEYTKQLEYQLKEKNEKIIELENMLKSILDLNIPTATLVKEFQRLETLEDETDELKLEIQYKDQEIFEFMNSDRGKLLKENKELKKEMADLSECWLKKDKIRNKIKEVENGKENYIFERLTSEDIRRTIITNLNELLK